MHDKYSGIIWLSFWHTRLLSSRRGIFIVYLIWHVLCNEIYSKRLIYFISYKH